MHRAERLRAPTGKFGGDEGFVRATPKKEGAHLQPLRGQASWQISGKVGEENTPRLE